ncbi:zinc ribbon domain-containing protein [Blautia pseudococcoides]|nr:zinc ribbon domain-containing protein [Blautia pseudococcoides]
MIKIKKIKVLCFCSLCVVVGIGLLFLRGWVGIGVIAGAMLVQAGCLAEMLVKSEKSKVCPECKSMIQRNARICYYCGYLYKNVGDTDLTELIEEEQEKLSSKEIDYNFEQVEEITVDEVVAFDGEIEEYLKKKGEIYKN